MEATDIVDELIINDDKVSLLKKHRNHIHNAFEVEVKLGFVSDTDSNGSQRWVEVRGQEENRKTAKVILVLSIEIVNWYFCSWASAQVRYYQNLVSDFGTKSDVISFIKLDGWVNSIRGPYQ